MDVALQGYPARWILQVVLVSGLLVAAPVSAGPVTGQYAGLGGDDSVQSAQSSGDERQQTGQTFSATSLFDAAGLPVLSVSAPTYLQLGERSKLRASSGTGSSGASTASFGNVGFVVGSDPSNLPAYVPSVAQAIPEPSLLLLLLPAAAFAAGRVRRGTHRR